MIYVLEKQADLFVFAWVFAAEILLLVAVAAVAVAVASAWLVGNALVVVACATPCDLHILVYKWQLVPVFPERQNW